MSGRYNRRMTHDNEIIYRPTKYPFEMVYASEQYAIQTDCFTDDSLYADERPTINAKMATDESSNTICGAQLFDSCDEAIDYAIKNLPFHVGEDGNVYPRVLKVRVSKIVEGVAFEPVMRDIEGGAKLEGVA